MSQYQKFVFDSYEFNEATKNLSLHYSYDDSLHFTEKYIFDFPFVEYDQAVLDRAIQNLFLIAGVSYCKAFMAPTIEVNSAEIDTSLAVFLSDTYQQGLGEFFFVNKFDPRTKISFPVNTDSIRVTPSKGTGALLGLGGGKDSLVTVEALRDQSAVATWSVGHRDQLAPLVERIGLPHFWVERNWDPKLKELNESGAYNGHVPISAILAAAGSVVAVLSGYRDVVVSNEQSSNEPTLDYDGVSINHQYSKSEAFEKAWQNVLTAQFGDSLQYYSFLRPLSELRIAELFAKEAATKYAGVFSSCNRAYRHGSTAMSWCGECPKCAFVYLALANFIPADELSVIFGGNNLLQAPGLEDTYRQLLGIEGEKPLECVGEVRECRVAMRNMQTQYPELKKYEFELDATYDYRKLYPHSMPESAYAKLEAYMARV